MLKIAVAGSGPEFVNGLCGLILEAVGEAQTERFYTAQEAFGYLSAGECGVLFIDIGMDGMAGLELVRRVRLSRPALNVICVADTEAYAAETAALHVSGYLVKPLTAASVKRELDDLRYPPEEGREVRKRVRAQCFGNFELFADGRAVRFRYKKTRELAAYLIDRCGAVCTLPEITATLWEEDMEEHPAYLKSLVRDLTSTLESLGCGNIIEKQWGGLGIRTDLIECDYYNWKRGVTEGVNTYRGEYMSQYSWGEFTNAGQLSGLNRL